MTQQKRLFSLAKVTFLPLFLFIANGTNTIGLYL